VSFLQRPLTRLRRLRFEDYAIQTSYTNIGNTPWASIEEFFGLVGTGDTHEEAIKDLEQRFHARIRHMRKAGDPIPLPGSRKGRARFAASDRIESLQPLVEDFWSNILGVSYRASFVSDESRLSAWKHYVPGGREEIRRRVKDRYGVDISAIYEEPIPDVLQRLAPEADQKWVLAQPNCYVYLCLVGEVAVGYMSAYRIPAIVQDGFFVYLYDILVRKDHRCRGLGSRMIEALKKQCSTDGVSQIWGGTCIENRAARRLLEVTGAELVSETYLKYIYDLRGGAAGG
jgi:GNAT superfamily N-acetyltransferase/predicted RNase H-like HicB family nuclease